MLEKIKNYCTTHLSNIVDQESLNEWLICDPVPMVDSINVFKCLANGVNIFQLQFILSTANYRRLSGNLHKSLASTWQDNGDGTSTCLEAVAMNKRDGYGRHFAKEVYSNKYVELSKRFDQKLNELYEKPSLEELMSDWLLQKDDII